MERQYIKFVSETMADHDALEEYLRENHIQLLEKFGVFPELIHAFEAHRTHVYRFRATAKNIGWAGSPYEDGNTAITAALRELEEHGHLGKRIDLEKIICDA